MSPSADRLIICEAKDFNVDIALAPIGYYFEPRCDDFFSIACARLHVY